LIENVGFLTQITQDNDELLRLLGDGGPCRSDDTLIGRAHSKETRLCDDFMDVKDFFYNVGRSLSIPTVMESKSYRD